MIYDRLGVPITEGAILYNMSRFNLECTLIAVTGLDAAGIWVRVYGIVLEWKWDACVGEDRAWSTLEHGIQHDYEIVGWYRR